MLFQVLVTWFLREQNLEEDHVGDKVANEGEEEPNDDGTLSTFPTVFD